MAASLACILCMPAALCRRVWGGSLYADGAASAGDPAAAQGEGAARVSTITVGGRTLTGPNSAAQYRGGRLLLPVTSIARALGDRVGVDAATGTITVQRQTGVAADFSTQLRQVRENGSVVLAVGGAADIVFPPDPEGLMLPVEIVSALLDASVIVDEAARMVRVTRGDVRAETVRDGARHASWELYQLEYEYDFNRYGTAYNQGLTLRASGRVGDGRFGLLTNSTGGKGADPSLLRNGTFTFERPNGQRFVAGDFGTGTDLEFISTAVRGAQFELPAGRARLTAFAGRAVSGVLPLDSFDVLPLGISGSSIQSLPNLSRLTYDTNVYGAYATFGAQPDGRPRGHLFSFSSGVLHFGGPGRRGEMAAGSVRYADARSHLQGDFGFGRFKGTQREGVDGAAAAADVSGSFNLTDGLTLQGRYAYTGANFLNPQTGLHDPVRLAAGGFTWRANRWVTASLNGSNAARPGLEGQRDRFFTSAFTLTPPRRGFPSVFFSHTQSSTPQLKAAAFTLLNVGRDFSRWRLFFNATRIKTNGPADFNAQTGAALRLGETGSLQLSQSFGSRGALGGTADWQSQPLFDRRLSLSAGFGYYRSGGSGDAAQHVSLSERLSATLRLPRESALQLSYLQTQGGPTMLLSLRGSLFKRRSAERAADAPVRELSRYGSFSGRVYQDVDGDGRFDAKVDRAQAGVKVRVDGNRYVETDTSGLYHVEEVKAGEHNVYLDLLSVRADLTMLDGPQQAATLTAGRDAIVDFRLVRTGRVAGVVWFDRNENGLLDEDEQPLADVRVVTGSGRDTLTDANGAFAVGDLPPGEYVLLLDEKTLPERTRSAGSLTVKVAAGTETGGLKFAVVALAPEVKRFSSK